MPDNWTLGMNAETGEMCDVYEEGIIDPVKVIEYAISNAITVASLLINTTVAIVNYPEKWEPGVVNEQVN